MWLVVSLIGTYFYIDFGGALGDSRIFLWLYAPVILFASRFAARREGAELNRLSQVIVTFGCGGLIYLMLVLGYNPALRGLVLGHHYHACIWLCCENPRS